MNRFCREMEGIWSHEGSSDARKFYFSNLVAEHLGYKMGQRVQERLGLHARLRQCQIKGKVWLHVFERDCDMVEVNYARQIDATPQAYDAFLRDLEEGAEGLCWASILTPREAREFKSSKRDRILEAFEDGHPWCV